MGCLLLHNSSKPFLHWIVTCDGKWIVYDNQWWPAQWLTEKKLQSPSQSQTCTKKQSGSLSGGLLPVWATTAFWILVKPLHLRSMLSKSTRCTKNCNARSQRWSTERARFFSTTTPNHISHNQCLKTLINGATKFCIIHHIHLTSHQLSLLQASW